MTAAPVSQAALDTRRVNSAAHALGVRPALVRSLLTINKRERRVILTAAAALADEAAR